VVAKQTGKKHGKGTVKSSNGFVNVACDSGRKQLVSLFTNRKDVSCVCSTRRHLPVFRRLFQGAEFPH